MGLVISGWGVISPIGIGVEAFVESLRSQRCALKSTAGYQGRWGLPSTTAGLIADFDVAKVLGTKKGTRVLDRTAALALAATTMAVRDAGIEVTPDSEERIGVVLGTSNGSIRSSIEFTSETVCTDTPYLVSPEAFPNTVMNFAAGQCSIWHRLKALNTTISGGRMACILALRYATRMIRSRYAEMLIVGSVEEFSEHIAWGSEFAARTRNQSPPPLGEGAAMFAIEESEQAHAAGRPVRAELVSCDVGFQGRGLEQQARAFADCIRRALARASLSPHDVWAVSSRESGVRDLDGVERKALELVFAGHQPPQQLRIGTQVGDCFSASGAMQLSAILGLFALKAEAERRPVAILTSVTHAGGFGCAVIRGS
jgi:3-oxoacyl-[acyl-carrier-protein] synthase II